MAAEGDIGTFGRRRQGWRAATGVARWAPACLPVVGRAAAVAAESVIGAVGRRRQRWMAATGVASWAAANWPIKGRATPVAAAGSSGAGVVVCDGGALQVVVVLFRRR